MIEPPREDVFGERETIADVARNLERWVHGAVVRTYAQARLEAFAEAAPRLRVVNALTDEEHPVPGAGRLPDADGAAAGPARPHAGVRRRRQQRRDLARAGRVAARASTSASRRRAGFELPAPRCASASSRAPALGGAADDHERSGRRRARRRRDLHGRVDVDGPGSRVDGSATTSSDRSRSTRR